MIRDLYLPPEWAPQSAVMLTWPHPHSDWAPILDSVEPVFAAIGREVAARERLIVSCFDGTHREHVRAVLAAAGADLERVDLYVVPSNDTWARDHGPITVMRDRRPVPLDFRFNGWGGKYAAELDDRLTAALAEAGAFQVPPEPVDIVLEGGSIETDGLGTLLTTSECLLAPTRNPQMKRDDLEKALAECFGIGRVLWLSHGHLAGDDTDGHVDTLARFCNPHTIAYVACDDPEDPHYEGLQAMAEELAGFRDAAGSPYRLVPLPMTEPKLNDAGHRLPATYANFLIINSAVLVPTYDDPADLQALERLAECFPDRQVVGIPSLPLVHQYGSLHCVTMQLPAGVV